DRLAADVHRLHRVGLPVHAHVQPGAEQVLVYRPGQPGRDLGGVRVPAGRVGRGEQHSGRPDLELDRAVQVEVPVEAVVVVAHRGEVGDHEPALAAGLGQGARAVEDVGVLPQDAGVFFVDADGVRYGPGLAGVVGDGGVQVGDLAQAVAAQLERVGPLADQVLTGVEVSLPVPELRVAVGYDHLRDRGPVEHRTVVQADLVQG